MIRIINPLQNLRVSEMAFKRNRVPMALVHVIAGRHFFVQSAQFFGARGIAIEIARNRITKVDKTKHFVRDFEDERGFVERQRLANRDLFQTMCAQNFRIHFLKT